MHPLIFMIGELPRVPLSEGLGLAGSVEWAVSHVKTEMTTK